MVTIYYGRYAWPAFSGTAILGGSYSVPTGSGCFIMILEQTPGGTIGQTHGRPADSPSDNAFGSGDPAQPTPAPQVTTLDEGPLTGVTISNLTTTTGNGTFTFSTATQTGVSGTITITGSQTFTDAKATRRALAHWQSLLRQAARAKGSVRHR
jgi:hypothetical protein